MNKSKVTLIIITYEQQNLFFDALKSALRQDIKCFKLIIIDDHSVKYPLNLKIVKSIIESDKSPNLEDYIIIKNPINEGTVRTLNKALSYIETKYYSVLSGDDVLPINSLSNLVNVISCNESFDLVSGQISAFQTDTDLKWILNPETTKSVIEDSNLSDSLSRFRKTVLGKLPKISLVGSVLRTDKIVELGGYDTTYRLLEDRPLILKMILDDCKFSFVETVTVYYRTDTGISNSIENPGSIELLRDYITLHRFYGTDPVISASLHTEKLVKKYSLKHSYKVINSKPLRLWFLLVNFFPIIYYFIVDKKLIAFNKKSNK